MTLHGVNNNKRKFVSIGDFRFTGRLLGKGNFARVEEAVHTVLNVKVAIKIIDLNKIKENYIVKNLFREAKIMSKLNHPCIVTLFQTTQILDNVYYLVTELVTGGDLCSFIVGQRYGKLEERPARIYGQQFVSALSHMHSFGIVHRDLKMENVMLNSSQTQIKIADFGLSNTYTNDCLLRTHCGSPEYAAPELFITNKQYGPEVDLWSLGIIFYGMVVGQLPFVTERNNTCLPNERRKKLVAQINKGLNIVHRQALAGFSQDFRSMINRLLTVDYKKRITTEDLRVHPWITEKGRSVIQIHPIQPLDIETQSELIRRISDLYKIEQKDVIQDIYSNPYGQFGGIYNILVYKYYKKQLSSLQIVVNKLKSKDTINQENSQQKVIERPKTYSKLQESNAKLKLPILPENKHKTETTTIQKRPVSTPIRNINQTTPKRQSIQTTSIKRTVLKPNKPSNQQRDKKTETPLQRQKSIVHLSGEKPKTAPVTKSVAGYLVKNVPEKILNLKMLKKQCFHTSTAEKKP